MVHAPLLLAGGGLANGLIAYRLKTLRPELPLMLLERDGGLGGSHTWSFHEHDLSAEQHAWLAPLVAHRWNAYEVRFPKLVRSLRSGYCTVTAKRFHEVLSNELGDSLRLAVRIDQTNATSVRTGSAWLHGCAVIDGRGPRDSEHLLLGYQKFLGREVRLSAAHGLTSPIVMDATVAQQDGYRFVYVLPFSSDTMLIEDTYYSDGPALAGDAMRARIDEYAQQRGWRIAEVLREETGVLPITLAGDIEAFWDADAGSSAGAARSGLSAALFHPTTGYSLPDAVRLADAIAALPTLKAASLRALTRARSIEQWRRYGFFRLLNRMLFRAATPSQRYAVLQRFYKLPEPLIRRFYAGTLTVADKARILAGRPPVPLHRALTAMLDSGLPMQRSS